jgi:hypothetical protein
LTSKNRTPSTMADLAGEWPTEWSVTVVRSLLRSRSFHAETQRKKHGSDSPRRRCLRNVQGPQEHKDQISVGENNVVVKGSS